MLQLDHRKSFDFDCFFQSETLPNNLLAKIRRVFGKTITIGTKTKEFITITTPEMIEVTFACHPYSPIHRLVKTSSLPLFHLGDLAANKAYTLGRRPAWRDYVDLFFLMKWNIYPLGKIIQLAEKKFVGEFNSKLLLQELTYFDDVRLTNIIFIKEPYTPEEIKNFLSDQVRAYLDAVLPAK